MLADVARSEARAGRTDNAVGLLKLNGEYYPASAEIPLALGDLYRQRGDTGAALASYREALVRDSTLGLARQRIAELTRNERHPPR